MPFLRRKGGRLLVVHSQRQSGRVTQIELATFGSPEEVEAILAPERWAVWQAAMSREHPGLRWSWESLARDLRTSVEGWPGRGSSPTELSPLARRCEALDVELARLTPAAPADARLLQELRPVLTRLAANLTRLLGPPSDPIQRSPPMLERYTPETSLFETAMERWWDGDTGTAVRLFRRVLREDPLHSDAHNHIGSYALNRGQLGEAARHFLAAIEGGARALQANDGLLIWAELDNRPFLRAHGNLALVYRAQRRYAEALKVHEQLLRWNPGDNQGIRYLVGEELHRLGDRPRAILAYRRADDDASVSFLLGLALLEEGQAREASRAWLRGMAQNRYHAPMLLMKPWTRLDGWHGISLAEPEHADEAVRTTHDLWLAVPAALRHLGHLWAAPAVITWREAIDDVRVALRDVAQGPRRTALLARLRELECDETLTQVLDGVGPVAAETAACVKDANEEAPIPVGNTWVTDMRHRVEPPGTDLPPASLRQVEHEGRIVEAGSVWGKPTPMDSALRCRRRPQRRACPGHLRVSLSEGVVRWACTRCRDNGRISHWEGTPWDLSTHTASDDALAVQISWSDFASLRQLGSLPIRKVLALATYGSQGPTLVGTRDELLWLATASDETAAEDVAVRLRAGLAAASSSCPSERT